MFAINMERLKERIGKETLVVCGAARGATSVVAYLLYEMGYFIGKDLGPRNYEDRAFARVIPPRRFLGRTLARSAAFTDLVAARNRDHARWGFKAPLACEHISELSTVLRNPVFVICVRNPLGVARSVLTREKRFTGGVFDAIHISRAYMEAIKALQKLQNAPALLINMDAAVLTPKIFLAEFSEVLNLSGDFAALEKAIRKPGYKEIQAP
ncbi:hypothetical protein [Rhodobacter lacus]|uniref:Sulfotransferase family protein n=1 Tax=Rhodobacter lacus TaxID=1641972 RepID=A0ABW5A7M0_9RHOB